MGGDLCETGVIAAPRTASRQRGINAPAPRRSIDPLIQRNAHIQELRPIVDVSGDVSPVRKMACASATAIHRSCWNLREFALVFVNLRKIAGIFVKLH
jgi:hypothetical protein